MSGDGPIWITEDDVVAMMHLGQAIEALEAGLRLEANGQAKNMAKTHANFGHGDTLHAIGATFEGAGIVGTKTWAHTEGGATPLLILWDAHTGALLSVIEAFAMGQMRTAAMTGVATKWMAKKDAHVFALIGTGKQALAQLAAVAAVRALTDVRVFGRDVAKRAKFVEAARKLGFGFTIEAAASVAEATGGADIVTLVTRAQEPIFTSAMAAKGMHLNAIGAIVPEREEFSQDILARASLIAADDPVTTRRLSKEFRTFFGATDEAWKNVQPISQLVAKGEGRKESVDISVFKAMGMGVSDLALGIKLHASAIAQGKGRAIDKPRKSSPRLNPNL